MEKMRSQEFEQAVTDLFEGNDDAVAFDNIVRVVGGRFDLVAFIFFLKDPEKYMPIRSRDFDICFRCLGVDSGLEGNCSWEKYRQYNAWIDEIRDYLREHVNKSITKIDAHSFLWLLGGLEKHIGTQPVEHKAFGKGTVVDGIDADQIRIRFGNKVRTFDRKTCFANGLLKFLPSLLDVYGRPLDVIPVDLETKEANQDEDRQLVEELKKSWPEDAGGAGYSGEAKAKPEPKIIRGRLMYPRNPQTARNALKLAGFKCEINAEDCTFIRKASDKPYTEPHHLVPMAFQNQFDVSLDREENIVSLCSNCHNEIHYGRDADRLISRLYLARKDLLESVGITVSLEALLRMYE